MFAMIIPYIRVMPDPATLAAAAAELFVTEATAAIIAKGSFSVALAGGSTPKAMYKLLASKPLIDRVKWDKIDFLFGDERCVPPEHEQSNWLMARTSLLDHVPADPARLFRMKGEVPAEEAAKEYGLMLKARYGGPDGTGGIDLVLLGMGDDGHTLSIFPNTVATREAEHRVIGYFAENSSTGKSWRVTMTAPFVNRAAHCVFLIAGASKTTRLAQVLEGPRDPERLPSQLIQPASGKLTFLLDAAAAGMDATE